MKVVATVRARDEEANIGRFCAAYQNIADVILVADGGSTDRTIEIAESYPKVKVLHFEETMAVHNGMWINPQGKHVNFLIKAALKEGADWITFDDCDCVPNYLLQEVARKRMESAMHQGKPSIFLRRIYMWGQDRHFPLLHKPNTSLWAFREEASVEADENDPWHLTMKIRGELNLSSLRPRAMHLEPPLCLLHFSWQTEEATDKKLDFYRRSGVQPTASHPKDFGGEIKPAEWFMKVESPDGQM